MQKFGKSYRLRNELLRFGLNWVPMAVFKVNAPQIMLWANAKKRV
jgi:hypothetical protein